ncbi:ParA family protein [Rosenbergiella nectarea]|uniref:ParA family protein n=1 Tax=Rosenbergiella nectarea TaxID=988801 RepID=UPI001F4DB263|nr:AAA family ATPase [Rosenbergiella nectarea]
MKILPVISTKGGEGKSTQAANLCGFLADAGLKTLLIDGDFGQPTASSIYQLTYEAPCGLYELLMQTVDLSDASKIISHSFIPNLDVIISNDPQAHLLTAMLHAPDGRLRMRMRNILQHPLFKQYDAIIIDSQGARSVMLELIVLAATDSTIGIVKPVLPDIREFLRGSIAMFEQLRSLSSYGIKLAISLANLRTGLKHRRVVRVIRRCKLLRLKIRLTMYRFVQIINEKRHYQGNN